MLCHFLARLTRAPSGPLARGGRGGALCGRWRLIAASLMLVSAPLAWAAGPKADVLVLLPASVLAPFSRGLTFALSERLNETAPDVRLHIEAVPTELRDHQLLQWVRQRLEGRAFDLVLDVHTVMVTQNWRAFAPQWRHLPIVTLGYGCKPTQRPADGITQLCVEDNPHATTRLMLALLPKTRHLALVGRPAYAESFNSWPAEAFVPDRQDVDVIDLRGLSIEALREALGRLPPRTALYLRGPLLDEQRRLIFPRRFWRELQPHMSVPVFTNLQPLMGHGVMGGAMLDAELPGQAAAEAVLQRLLGQTVTVARVLPTSLQVDWRELQRLGLDEASLPAGVDVLFREPSPWQRYRWPIVVTGLVLLLYSMLLVRLLMERQRRRAAELRARQRLAELAHLNRLSTVSQLSLSLAHELNQPLCSILSTAQTCEVLLDQPEPSPHELRRLLQRIVQANGLASRIVGSLRGLAQKQPTDRACILVDRWVRDTAGLLTPDARLRQVSLLLELQAPDAQVMGDRAQLQQVLINLMINAMDAMQETDLNNKQLLLSTRRLPGDRIELCLDDSGPGLPQQNPNSVFEPFFSTKRQGLGLGLSIARELAQAHGGELLAANLPQGGARFALVLPLWVPQTAGTGDA